MFNVDRRKILAYGFVHALWQWIVLPICYIRRSNEFWNVLSKSRLVCNIVEDRQLEVVIET